MAELKSLTIGGKSIYDLIYPIGSVYETENSGFNPNTSFTGTWEKVKGKVLVGVDEEDSDFNTPKKTGGEKRHTLTVAEIPPHVHQQYVTANTGTDGQRLDYKEDKKTTRYPQCDTGSTGGGSLTTTFNRIIRYIFGEEQLKKLFLHTKGGK